MEATPDGGDVFFVTAAQLVPQDTDTAFDIYDARVCSEASPCLPAPPAAAQAPCDTSTSCRPTQPTQTLLGGAPASAMFSGAGNLAPPSPPPPPKPLTRAEKLTRALKACRRKTAKAKRLTCERQARRKYGPRKKPKAKKARSHGGER